MAVSLVVVNTFDRQFVWLLPSTQVPPGLLEFWLNYQMHLIVVLFWLNRRLRAPVVLFRLSNQFGLVVVLLYMFWLNNHNAVIVVLLIDYVWPCSYLSGRGFSCTYTLLGLLMRSAEVAFIFCFLLKFTLVISFLILSLLCFCFFFTLRLITYVFTVTCYNLCCVLVAFYVSIENLIVITFNPANVRIKRADKEKYILNSVRHHEQPQDVLTSIKYCFICILVYELARTTLVMAPTSPNNKTMTFADALKLANTLQEPFDESIDLKLELTSNEHPVNPLKKGEVQKLLQALDQTTSPTIARFVHVSSIDLVGGAIVLHFSSIKVYNEWFKPLYPALKEYVGRLIGNRPIKGDRVKIHMKVINFGEESADGFLKKIGQYNPKLDLRSWSSTGFRDLKNGYVIVYFLVDPTSLEPIKKANNCITLGVNGLVTVNFEEREKKNDEDPKKRKLGINYDNA